GGANPLNDTHRLSLKTAAPFAFAAVRVEALPHPKLTGGSLARSFDGDFHLSELIVKKNGSPLAIRSATATAATPGREVSAAIDSDPLTGWSVGGGRIEPVSAVFTLAEAATFAPGDEIEIALAYLSREEQQFIGRFRVSLAVGAAEDTEITQPLREALLADDEKTLRREFRESADVPSLAEIRRERDRLLETLAELRRASTTRVMVMRERPGEPRPTHLLERGLYDRPGELVVPEVPA